MKFNYTRVLLCAVISGVEGWQDIENFGKAKINFF
ncbi:MAG: hypothetical protein K1060chlam1_00143 [Candidatus Anoxychlamydiales bacterium]|nr:hypothetical protein [Candidatus Anoxychlamydiales bacterium]